MGAPGVAGGMEPPSRALSQSAYGKHGCRCFETQAGRRNHAKLVSPGRGSYQRAYAMTRVSHRRHGLSRSPHSER